jgi:hypothetical protein
MRSLLSTNETMEKYFGEIERLVYAAEIMCPKTGTEMHRQECKRCIWVGSQKVTDRTCCKLKAVREIMGYPFDQKEQTIITKKTH